MWTRRDEPGRSWLNLLRVTPSPSPLPEGEGNLLAIETGVEDFLHAELPIDDALLRAIAQERLNRSAILADRVGDRVEAQDLELVLECFPVPEEAGIAVVEQLFKAELFGLDEGIEN